MVCLSVIVKPRKWGGPGPLGLSNHEERKSIPVAARSRAWVYGCSHTEIVGSNPACDMNVCLLWVLSVVRDRSLRHADHSTRAVLPSVVCLSMIKKPRREGLDPLGLPDHEKKGLKKILLANLLCWALKESEGLYQETWIPYLRRMLDEVPLRVDVHKWLL
jgi:hypothetical protein